MKKVILFTMLAACSILSLHAQTATTPSGSGTSIAPYRIATINNLYWLSQNSGSWGSYYIQTANIDASGTSGWDGGNGFSPIGNGMTKFTGHYNGRGHTINNLFINRPSTDYIGLFGYTSGALIDSLGIANCNVAGNEYVGGLAGYNYNASTVSNCYVTVSVTGTNEKTGGLVGCCTNYATVSNSYATGSVTGLGDYTGGLVGHCYPNVTVSNSYATGSITSTGDYTGGLIGRNSRCTIENSYATGPVNGVNSVGGLVGNNYGYNGSSTISNCYSTGNVTGSGSKIGGFLGGNSSYGGGTPMENNCYYNSETCGQSSGIGDGTTGNVTGLTTAQMKQQSNFSGWDFSTIWAIDGTTNSGYPYLFWQSVASAVPFNWIYILLAFVFIAGGACYRKMR